MKKAIYLIITMALLVALASPGSFAKAQSATATSWTSSITYYTPSDTSGSLTIKYYDGPTSYTAGPLALSPNKAGSLFIGSTEVPEGFAGSAVLSADVPIVATYVQLAAGSEVNNYGRMMYNAFKPGNAGSTFYVPTVLNQTAGFTSRVGVQNIESFKITATLKFFEVGETTPTVQTNRDIDPFASYVFSPGDVGLPTPFNGSMVVTAVKQGDPGTNALVVASSEETQDSGRGAYAFEGTASAANKVYMPSMLSAYQTAEGEFTSYYAIQASGGQAQVRIKYYDTAGNLLKNTPQFTINDGSKESHNPVGDGVASNKIGSAVIESTGAPIMVIAKIVGDNGVRTAFPGEAVGSKKVAAPYIRWSADAFANWRSYVAVMNVDTVNATSIIARYYDANGNKVGEENLTNAAHGGPLPPSIKRNTSPASANALDGNGDFGILGGAVEIESDANILVVVRVQKNVSGLEPTTLFAEDYNGVDVSTP